MMKNKNTLLSAIALSIAIASCGGGGGSDTPTKPTTPTTPTQPTTTIDEQFGLWLTDLANNIVIPQYQAMETSADTLVSQSQTFCALSSPSASDLDALKAAWADFNQTWQYIQWLKVGPILEESRLFRVQFWPDANNAVGRGIDNLLILQETITSEIVASQNVGAQGIPALEKLLFSDTAETSMLSASNAEKRCEAVVAISQNLKNISSTVYQGWISTDGNYIAQLTEGNGDFSSRKDAVEEVVTNWLEQIERTKDEKMLEPLALNSPGIPTIIEFTMSNQSVPSIKTNAQSFVDIYTAKGGHGFDDILNGFLEQPSIATQMQEKVDAANAAAALLTEDYKALLADDAGRQQITDAIQKLRELRDLLTADFVQATDINIGFNSNDGD